MKRISSVILVLVAGVVFFAGAKQITAGQPKDSRSKDTIFANSLADGGRIRMKHSPILGMNVAMAVRIDGVPAGVFSKGHVYERYLTPGRHDLYVSQSRQQTGSWRGTLDVRRGETYSFVVKVTSNQVVLLPSRID
ncbi:MAG TPA: hypothetical protein VNP98_01165 [Chthoniobacterales bacterium]|nr:hypothetical protein [Chthoniobacterales bacterium]